jgi:hypothetical protein
VLLDGCWDIIGEGEVREVEEFADEIGDEVRSRLEDNAEEIKESRGGASLTDDGLLISKETLIEYF